jgi:hypothetical protein
MADSKPVPAPDLTPGPPQPPGDPGPPAEPTKNKSVVLRTRDHLTVFQVPADLDADGNPKGEPLTVDHLGVALSRKAADDLQRKAASAGVELIDTSTEQKD